MQNRQIILAQIAILYSQSTSTFVFPSLTAIILVFPLWNIADRSVLLGWVSMICIYSVCRYLVLLKYLRSEVNIDNASRWLDMFIGMACLSGIMWGMAAIILIPHDASNLVDFTLYTCIILLAIAGLVAGATISYSICLTALIFFTLPALLPPALYLITLGDIYSSMLGGFVMLYSVFVVGAGYKLNRQLMRFIHTEDELEKLKMEFNQLRLLYEKAINRTKN